MWDFNALRMIQQRLWTERPSFWNRVFNLRFEFSRKLGIQKPETLAQMIEILNLPPMILKSALDECKAQYLIIEKIQKDGYVFNIPENLTEKAKLSQMSSLWEYSPQTVRILGITWDTTINQLIDFFEFSSLKIQDVILCSDNDSRPLGFALVKFPNYNEATISLSMSGMFVGGMKVQITRACQSDFEKFLNKKTNLNFSKSQIELKNEVSNEIKWTGLNSIENLNFFQLAKETIKDNATLFKENSKIISNRDENIIKPVTHSYKSALDELSSKYSKGSIVFMKGFPYSSNISHITEFLQGFHFLPDSIILVQNEEGKSSGEAFVAFVDSNEASKAISKKNRDYIGTRYVDLIQVI